MRSSYIGNNYGEVFYNIVARFAPAIAVELGVLDGYSTFHIARGIKKNKFGYLNSYDLWEDYLYKHGSKEEVEKMLIDEGVKDYVTLYKEDAFKVYQKYTDNTIHLLHVDISNDGKVLYRIMQNWDSKMVYGGVILFEGGSEERDNVEWMVKYNKRSIKKELESNEIIKEKYIFGTYLKFPSLTMLLKKR